MKQSELNSILKNHALWCAFDGGERADLSDADLSRANLSRANLSDADLSDADLSDADLSDADLSWANLSWANLSMANLSGANLFGADLSGANLSGANFRYSYGGNATIEQLQAHPHRLTILDNICWGGCTKKTLSEWLEYDGSELCDDDKNYLETITKPFIKMIIAKRALKK